MQILRWLMIPMLSIAFSGPLTAQGALRIAAAADLEPVLPPVLAQFEQSTGIRAEASYESSATLTAEILNGAPFDVFLSADLGFPKRLIEAGAAFGAGAASGTGMASAAGMASGPGAAGAANSSAPVTYARGALVLWTRRDSQLPAPSLELLRDPRLRQLAIANPQRAPYGRAAVEALRKLGIYDTLKPRLATAENIAQAAQFVDSGNADAGLISLTAALTPRLRSVGFYFVVPRDLYAPIEQGAVIVSRTRQRASAQKFLDFLLSTPVQNELAKSGLAPAR